MGTWVTQKSQYQSSARCCQYKKQQKLEMNGTGFNRNWLNAS
jgi:hypothetical protein